MIKKLHLLSGLALIIEASWLFASPVDEEKAMKIAKHFALENKIAIDYSKSRLIVLTPPEQEEKLAYVFNGLKKGFVIVAADDQLPPVVAFSTENLFTNPSPLASLVVSDLSLRMEHIAKLKPEILQQNLEAWNRLYRDSPRQLIYDQWPAEGTTSTGGWTITHWHQNAPYNNFCPLKLSSGQRSLTGCPATAMAQILFYHQKINSTRFAHSDRYYHNYTQAFWIDDTWSTYDYLSFNSINTYLNTIEQKFASGTALTDNEMAALSLAAGFACKSVYDPAGSGTYSVAQAYQAYLRFGFNSAVLLDSSFTDEQIRQKMIENIKNALPVHLATVDQNWYYGHNVVCDGYRSNGFFRLNMGWGGSYDNWYSLPEGFPMSLTVFEGIVADIAKPDTTHYKLTLLANPDSVGATLTGEGNYTEGTEVNISASPVDGYIFTGWTGTTADVNLLNHPDSLAASLIMPGRPVALTACYAMQLFNVSFLVFGTNATQVRDAAISINPADTVLVTDEGGFANVSLNKGEYFFTVTAENYMDFSSSFMVSDTAVSIMVNLQGNAIKPAITQPALWPVPCENFLLVKNAVNIADAELKDMQGVTIYKTTKCLSDDLCIPVSGLVPGCYFVKLKTSNGVTFSKMVVKK